MKYFQKIHPANLLAQVKNESLLYFTKFFPSKFRQFISTESDEYKSMFGSLQRSFYRLVTFAGEIFQACPVENFYQPAIVGNKTELL